MNPPKQESKDTKGGLKILAKWKRRRERKIQIISKSQMAKI